MRLKQNLVKFNNFVKVLVIIIKKLIWSTLINSHERLIDWNHDEKYSL